MQILRSIHTGDLVVARRQTWRVTSVRSFEQCALVALAGAGPGNAGVERHVLTPFDAVELRTRRRKVVRVGARQWRRRCRHQVQTSGPSSALHTAERARIDLLPHQLEPALAVVTGLAPRVLIADEVGLGKTIQAGLIIAELTARGAADRVLVLTPAGLRDQWAGELAERFGVEAAILDMRDTRRRTAMLPSNTSPWSTVPLAIASIDYVKRPEVLPLVQECRWDLVVVDEAHFAAATSDRHSAVAALCRAAPCVVLLTATPHSGDATAFQSLCRLGSQGDHDNLLIFRRTRHEVALCPARHVHNLHVRPSPAESRMHAELAALAAAVRHDLAKARRTESITHAGANAAMNPALVLTMLHKRALSSPRSLEQSIARRLAVLNGPGQPLHQHIAQLELPLDAAGETDEADLAPEWSSPIIEDPHTERRLLTRLARAATAAAADESKLAALARLLARLIRRGERAIVFTEYRDTLLHVRERLALRVALLHGGLSRAERTTALQSFARGHSSVLLATDAAGEGLNLQHGCRVVINLELPWNPMRLEQRIGRVDRIGQHRAVHAFHLVASGTGESKLFDRLRARIARARHDIGAADPLSRPAAHNEAAVSRWLLDGIESELDTSMPLHRLSADAAQEHARLTIARRMAEAGASHASSPGDTLVARTRRWQTRSQLAGRCLTIARTEWADQAGHSVASHVSAALHVVPVCPTPHSLAPSAADRANAVQAHEQFWRTRLRREQASLADLQQRVTASASGGLQPGLFDQRAERRGADTHAQLAGAVEEAQQRVDAARRAASVSMQPTRIVLVLEP